MKKILMSFLSLLAIVALVGCTITTSDDKPDDPVDPVEKELENFVIVLPDGSSTRVYKEAFDEMINDFSTTSAANVNSHLRVAVGDKLDNPANSADAAIYKMATGVYPIETYDGIGFKIRKMGVGKLELSNLVLALRGDDAYDVFEISLADAVDPDGDPLSELTTEYQDLVICPNLSIEDDATEYQLAGNAGASGTKVLDKILGFHLYLKGECSEILEIEEVYLVKGADKTTLDSFNREKVNKPDDTCWWRDSRGFIVQQGFEVNKGQDLKFTYSGEKTNLVLNVMGDTTNATLNGKAWAELKDQNGNNIPNAVNGAFFPIVINLEKSGLTSGEFTLSSNKEVVVSQVFASDLEDREIVTKYPEIDSKHVNMIDNFNRTQIGFDGDYDKSITNPVVIGAGLNYALSYNNGDKVAVQNGYVTFDATSELNYINFKEGKTNYAGEKYLVLLVKGSDGATLDGFRINVGNGEVYINQMFSAFGLHLPKLADTEYPYIDANGFTWLIIDLAESGMVPNATDGFIDMYYTGKGKLMIDAIFYADLPGVEYEEKEIANISKTISDTYEYGGGFSSDGVNLVRLDFTCDNDVATLEPLRLQGDGMDFRWFKDGHIIDVNGNVVDAKQKLNGLSIIIDLTASELSLGWNHLHVGGLAEYPGGAFTMKVTSLAEKSNLEAVLINEITSTTGPSYVYANGFSSDGANLVRLDFECEDENATLVGLRLQGDGMDFRWFKDGQIVDANGKVVDANQKLKCLSIVIDLTASELSLGWNHLHVGGLSELEEASFTVKIYKLVEPAKWVEKVCNVVEGKTGPNYEYCQGFSSDGVNLVRLDFECEDENATLVGLRLQGDGMDFRWFKDGQIVDADGKVVDANQKLKGLSIVIDLTASELSLGWNHLHAGGLSELEEASFKLTFTSLAEVNNYEAIMAALVQ